MSKGNWGQGHLKIPYSYERYLIQSLTPLAKKTNTILVSYPFYHFDHPSFQRWNAFTSLELECALPTLGA